METRKNNFCLKCQRIVDEKGREVLIDIIPDPESIDFCNSCNDDPEATINYLLDIIEKNRHHIPMSIEEQLIRNKYEL